MLQLFKPSGIAENSKACFRPVVILFLTHVSSVALCCCFDCHSRESGNPELLCMLDPPVEPEDDNMGISAIISIRKTYETRPRNFLDAVRLDPAGRILP